MLKLHELLHKRASTQGLSLIILACTDSFFWLEPLVNSTAAVEAVLEVLVNDYGFELEVEADAALQGQEAAWAVLAAVSRHAATNGLSPQASFHMLSGHHHKQSPYCSRHLVTLAAIDFGRSASTRITLCTV